ncbi:hypothetical protein LTR62_008243 [Meristemomyces frigidus]|uniref:Uncharacterized protein n=1 Tax=Meristemomyces frigidus TaxID=1508187 RepID=A0AAN7TB93_9PEZI|nr:hypothetical protein LTR62_008243 [Meristemomyces frigidus]
MSQSMPIPKRKQPVRNTAASWTTTSTASSYSSPSHGSTASPITTTPSSIAKGKFPASSPRQTDSISQRRPSLLSSSLSKSEYTVLNLGHDDGPPRLVTCVKSEQGFDWNQELFLPSYANYDSQELETRQDPVEDIVLTDEEAAAMMPQ